jgi:hypothetical protein
MKVLKIETPNKLRTKHLYGRFYTLTETYIIRVITTEGTIVATLRKGWVTDFRSGSSIIDAFIPWKGSDEYNAGVLFHDMCYSGWLSRGLADEILYQVCVPEIGKFRSKCMYQAVHSFGSSHYFNLTDAMPNPYSLNRQKESLRWDCEQV